MHVYEFNDYRKFIIAKTKENESIRGYQVKLAAAANCSKSYLSQVMNSSAQLTPDHAANLADFWNFNDEETLYFIDLVNLDRSSSSVFKKILNKKISDTRKNYKVLKNKFSQGQTLNSQDLDKYYSSWLYSALHILLTIPEFDSENAIANRLQVPLSAVQEILLKLEQFKLIKKMSKGWKVVNFDLHVQENSDKYTWAKMHNINWRFKNIIKLQEERDGGLHYTGVHTMSKSDAVKIKNLFAKLVQESRQIISPSPEEELYCMLFDFFIV